MPLFSLVLVSPAGVPLYVARSGDTWGVATGPRDATKYSSVPDAVGAAEGILGKPFPGQWPWLVGDVEVRVERVAEGHAFEEIQPMLESAVAEIERDQNRLVVSAFRTTTRPMTPEQIADLNRAWRKANVADISGTLDLTMEQPPVVVTVPVGQEDVPALRSGHWADITTADDAANGLRRFLQVHSPNTQERQ